MTTNLLIVGSGFLAAQCLVRAAGFNDVSITVIDRKDPLTIINYNQDVFRMFQRYCRDISYKDIMNPQSLKKYGDPKRNIEFKFKFLDIEKEDRWWEHIDCPDIIFNAGGIYDRLYAELNPNATVETNTDFITSLTRGINGLAEKEGKKPLFIHFSSINVYGDMSHMKGEKAVIDESTKPNPIDPLNKSLLNQEQLVTLSALSYDYAIMRLGTLIGYFTPAESLVNQAVLALLKQDDKFALTNSADESIELMDLTELGHIINAIILKQQDPVQLNIFKNQTYNVKVEEPEPKTIFSVVNAIYQGVNKLPKINGVKLSAPEITQPLSKKPVINFGDVPISSFKFQHVFNWVSTRPTIFSLLHSTVAYLVDYRIAGLPDEEKETFKRIFAIEFTPTEASAKKADVNQDVIETVKDVNKEIEKI